MLSWEGLFCLTLNNKSIDLWLAEEQQSGKTKGSVNFWLQLEDKDCLTWEIFI